MWASKSGQEAVVRTLLSSGANVNQAEVRNDDDMRSRRAVKRVRGMRLVVLVAAIRRGCGWRAIVIVFRGRWWMKVDVCVVCDCCRRTAGQL